ncbi:hypothetical protein AMATHDRAFT_61334 [Amanita thiersii Skay4041]|uniref:Uncharacterized protein n=1 Tax=Amanita thiersii Skay4041 TaxID=703135 RepID=A0A2A9NRA4_9AGAR|nr:hypothetical protein AMATHDRAFT_61334 [Amanita thiersii Skay4041]
MSFTTGVYLVYHQNPQNKEYYLVGRDFYETPVNLDPKPLYNKIDNAEPVNTFEQ